MDIAQAMEASESQSRQIVEDNQFAVYAVGRQNRGRNQPQHQRHSQKRPNQAKPTAKQCTRCGIKGHSADDCRCSRGVGGGGGGGGQTDVNSPRGRQLNNETPRRNTVRCVNEHTSQPLRDSRQDFDSDSDDVYTDEYAFALQDSADISPVTINGITVGVIIDSGASCNIINSAVANQLRDIGSTFNKCRRRIHPYESPPLVCKEYLTANVRIHGVKPVSADFLVVPGTAPSLLGKATAQHLGILKVGVNHVSQSNEPSSPDKFFAKYPGLCESIGCLKDTEVMLHIDKSIPPVASKHSRTPFHMRDKVASEIEHLEKQGVIEKISGPTEWVSRIVTPPKPKIRAPVRSDSVLT